MAMRSVVSRRNWLWCLSLPALLMVLSSCAFFGSGAPPAKPATWTNYQSQVFAMNYYTSWNVSTRGLYLGTSYPPLEALQGMIFSDQGSPTTFVQVVYAENTDGKASISDLLSKYILGTVQQPVAASSLTTTTLAGQTWSQGTLEKQVSSSGAPGGSALKVKETALGVSTALSSGKQEVFLIVYQDSSSTYSQTQHDYFTRMVNSFQFGP